MPDVKDMPDLEPVRTALHDVIDPELGINVVELGMVRRIERAGNKATVSMVLTSMSCPFWDLFVDQVQTAVIGVDGVKEVEVKYDPSLRWSPDLLSDSARWELEIQGLLPTTTWLNG
jgi:metal-sulfur cluster biosynthetic enzyme